MTSIYSNPGAQQNPLLVALSTTKIIVYESMGNEDNTILVGVSDESYYSIGSDSRIELINMSDSSIIWRSPKLLGNVSRDSMHIFERSGDSSKYMAVSAKKTQVPF